MKLLCVIAITLLACDAIAQQPQPITHGTPPVMKSIIPDFGLHKRGRKGRGQFQPPKVRVDRCDLTPAEQTLVQNMRVAIRRLEERRASMDARQAALKALRRQVQTEMEALRALQKKLSGVLDKKDEEAKQQDDKDKAKLKLLLEQRNKDRQGRIGELAKILKKMKPEQAALILARAGDQVAIDALQAIGARIAGKIVAKLPPDRASDLMKLLVMQPTQDKETP